MAKHQKSSRAKTRLDTGSPEIGARIRRARTVSGLTQVQLADVLQVTKGLISQWETGQTMPSVNHLGALGRVLGGGLDSLVYGPEDNVVFERGRGTFDDRLKVLPDALRVFVILAIECAERAQHAIPVKFITPPIEGNWVQFAAYLDDAARKQKEKTEA
jgi:transcriptional regulator with XRE-family HTH domain